MKIHSTAKFEGFEIPIHNAIEVNIKPDMIIDNIDQLVNISLSKMKAKIESYNMIYSTMCFFEVYYYSIDNEVSIFKKEKKV